VRDHCESLLQGLNGGKFADPDFRTDLSSIKNSSDLVPTLPKISWRRPHEISLKSELVGFDKLNAQTGK